MDATTLIIAMVFGSLGLGYVIFAKNAARISPAIAGLALMIVPYFISSAILMVVVCLALAAVPFVFRDV